MTHIQHSQRFLHFTFLVALGLISAGGCNFGPTLYPASGVVRINGEPASGATLLFHPSGKEVDGDGTLPFGLADEEGAFVLSTYKVGDGVPEGNYRVTITWPQPSADGDLVDRLQNRYGSPESAVCTVEIKPGDNQLAPIELSAKLAPLGSNRELIQRSR